MVQGLEGDGGEGHVEGHAVQAPCVFELVAAPEGGDGGGFGGAEVGGEFFGDGFGAEERAVEVECDYGFVRG